MTGDAVGDEVEAAALAALGGPVPGRLVDAAAVVNEAVACTRLDAGSVLLTAVGVIRSCRARGGGAAAARAALAERCWAVSRHRELAEVCAALAALAAAWGDEGQLAAAARVGAALP